MPANPLTTCQQLQWNFWKPAQLMVSGHESLAVETSVLVKAKNTQDVNMQSGLSLMEPFPMKSFFSLSLSLSLCVFACLMFVLHNNSQQPPKSPKRIGKINLGLCAYLSCLLFQVGVTISRKRGRLSQEWSHTGLTSPGTSGQEGLASRPVCTTCLVLSSPLRSALLSLLETNSSSVL